MALLGVTVQITACSGLLTSDTAARQYYLLEPYTGYSGADTGEARPVLVISVSAVPGLDTDHIQALGADARLIQYANARWTDFLPEVLTSLVRRSLVSTGRFETVTTKSGSNADQWWLELEVQQFYGIQHTPGETASVEVRLEGSLVCNGNKHHLLLSANKIVGQERLSTVVAAHQHALDDVTRQLLEQFNSNC